MRRRLNVKLLVILLGVCVVVGPGVHFLHAFQAKRAAKALLRQADRADEEKRPDQAADFLRRYLVQDPRNNDVWVRYGLTLADLAKSSPSAVTYDKAFQALAQVLRRDPGRADVRRKLVDVAMAWGHFSVAAENLNVLLKEKSDDGELHQLLGMAHLALQANDGAVAELKAAIKLGHNEYENAHLLAITYWRRLNQPKEADKVFDDLVKGHPESYEAYLHRALYRKEKAAGEDDLKKAAEDVNKAKELAPDKPEVLLAAAEVAAALKDDATARENLEKILTLKDKPKGPRPYQMLAELDQKAGKPDDAIEHLRAGLKEFPDHPALVWKLADLLITQGKLEEANQQIAILRKAKLPVGWVAFLEARVLVHQNKWPEARDVLEDALARLEEKLETAKGDNREVLKAVCRLLGQCCERLGDNDRQLAVFDKLAKLDSSSAEARAGRGTALAAMGRYEEAFNVFSRLNRTPEVRGHMIRLLIRRNWSLPEGRRSWAEVDQLLDEAKKDNKTDPVDLAMLQADVLIARGDLVGADKILADARKAHPDKPGPWLGLAELAEFAGKPEDALRILTEAEKTLGDCVELRLAKAAYWVRRGGADVKKRLAELGDNTDHFTKEKRQRFQNRLALDLAQAGDKAGAAALWKRLAKEQPQSLDVRLFLFDLALEGSDEAEIQQAVQAIKDVEGTNGTYWHYAHASYLAWKAKGKDKKKLTEDDRQLLAEARRELAAIAPKRPGWSRIPLAEARIDDQEGKYDRALEKYLKAIDLGERAPDVVQRTIQLLGARQRYDEIGKVIHKLPEQAVLQSGLPREAAVALWQEKDNAMALRAAEAAVPKDSKDFHDHVWRGQIFLATQKKDEAEKSFRRAVELAPNEADAWAPLIQFLAGTNKEEAEKELAKAEAKIPPATARQAFAACYEALGRNSDAEKMLRAALAARPDDPVALRNFAAFQMRAGRAQEALPHLYKLSQLRDKAQADAEWGQRVLALVLASDGNWQHGREALAIVEDLEKAPGAKDSPDVQRLKALVLALQKGRDDRKKAIKMLDEVIARQPNKQPTAEEKSLLAELYQSTGDWPRARGTLYSLLEEQPDNAEVLAKLSVGLIRAGDLDKVPNLLTRLEKLEPKELRTLEVKVRLWKAQGHADDAVKALTTYAENTKDARIDVVAALLDEFGRPEAEKYYRLWLEREKAKTPEVVLILADYLGRQKRTKEALDLCEGAWRTCPPQAVARACVHILYAGKPDDEQLRRVENWLKEAMRQKGQEIGPLHWHLAALYNLAHRFGDAEDLYRRIAQQDPTNALAMNNLAFLMALRPDGAAEALIWIKKAIDIVGELPSMLDTRAVVFLALGKADLAVRDLREAVAEYPTASTYFHLAQAELAAKNYGAAVEAFTKAQSLKLDAASLHPREKPVYESVVAEIEKLKKKK
jgi:tetratricopeptide (TPR) repeat protein